MHNHKRIKYEPKQGHPLGCRIMIGQYTRFQADAGPTLNRYWLKKMPLKLIQYLGFNQISSHFQTSLFSINHI